MLGLNLRAEHFRPRDGVDNTDDLSFTEITASGVFKIGDLSIIPELRFDLASDDAFTKNDEFQNNQVGFLIGAVYSF